MASDPWHDRLSRHRRMGMSDDERSLTEKLIVYVITVALWAMVTAAVVGLSTVVCVITLRMMGVQI